MLVICEDCAKKYNIDESRIRGNRARFTCNECGHIIIVDKADLNRSFISSANPGGHRAAAASVDLLQAMEMPVDETPGTGCASGQQEANSAKCERRKPHWKFRGIPLFVYFILIVLFSLLSVSLVTGYLYTEYLYHEYMADIVRGEPDYRHELLLDSSLAFGATWLFVLLVISIFGRRLHAKFCELVVNANQLASGEYNIEIVKKGSREVRDLAFALERIRQRMRPNS